MWRTMNWGDCWVTETVRHLSLDELEATQSVLTLHFKGRLGVRDRGWLECALHRPRTGNYEGLAAMAAAFMEALLLKHAFNGCNRRAAFFASDTFLRLNGWKLKVEPRAAQRVLGSRPEQGPYDYEHLHRWIRESIVRL